jgi:hypothetical protein
MMYVQYIDNSPLEVEESYPKASPCRKYRIPNRLNNCGLVISNWRGKKGKREIRKQTEHRKTGNRGAPTTIKLSSVSNKPQVIREPGIYKNTEN